MVSCSWAEAEVVYCREWVSVVSLLIKQIVVMLACGCYGGKDSLQGIKEQRRMCVWDFWALRITLLLECWQQKQIRSIYVAWLPKFIKRWERNNTRTENTRQPCATPCLLRATDGTRYTNYIRLSYQPDGNVLDELVALLHFFLACVGLFHQIECLSLFFTNDNEERHLSCLCDMSYKLQSVRRAQLAATTTGRQTG